MPDNNISCEITISDRLIVKDLKRTEQSTEFDFSFGDE